MQIMKFSNSIGLVQDLQCFFDTEENEFLDQMVDAGIDTLQVVANAKIPGLVTEENAEKLLRMTEGKLRITSVWGMWSGPNKWDFIDGPLTLGLVPEAYRSRRLSDLCRCADFAQVLGVHDMATHVGFVPEQPCYQGYRELVSAVRYIAEYCAERNLYFNFETGQETPVTLMRLFSDVGADNLGVNLDPANLIIYGRGNPIDALSIYGDKIRGVHVKDADYPKGNFNELGEERIVGEGTVNYPLFLPGLLAGGYKGDLYIEREISGVKRVEDVKTTISYIKKLMGK